ncbi:protein transporter tim10 [Malassezia yamatoensis]|uniref:Mitochondrial import inner membrane translocase subunit n=1 Tax=Malassezia yamatoensis TaxID=253288 RepID=A0AAJ6CIK3_9BASI|nr:protein transporter tim10 [Malassezia yamatoensis]
MALFGGGGSSQPAANSAQIEAATAELDMITDVFNRLVDACHTKCISTRYAEPDLNKGESVCLDRCVAKFFAVNAKVGEQMQAIGQSSGMGASPSGGMFG